MAKTTKTKGKTMPAKKSPINSTRRTNVKKSVSKKTATNKTAAWRGGLLPKFKFNRLTAGALILLFAAVGSYVVFRSQAAVPPPPAGGYFSTLPVGSALPSDAECSQRVRRSTWEPRAENKTANQTVPSSVSLPGFVRNDGGVDNRSRAYADRVTGNFKGTTDEIIQWGACKWGFSDDVARAVAVAESWWRQSTGGDITNDQSRCREGYTAPCPESFGLMQVRATSHRGTFPSSRDSTAFNVDYVLMVRRVCYEGWVTWLYDIGYSNYQAGDEWGCVGLHYSGRWYDSGANNYINTVKGHFANKPWRTWTDQGSGDTTATNAVGNLASGKPVTTGATWSENLPRATDGDRNTANYVNMAGGPQWLRVDLGQSHDLGNIKLWHYYADGRTYRDVIVQLSDTADFSSGVTTVFNNDTDNSSGQGTGRHSEYAETATGKEIAFASTKARYVRFWSNGSTSNGANHYVEVEVYAAGTSTSTPPPPTPTADTVAPIASIATPANGARVGRRVGISANATDNTGVTKMELYIDGRLQATAAAGSISHTWNTRKASNGAHTITVKAHDAAGNAGQSSVTVYK